MEHWIDITRRIFDDRYPAASVIFLAGSLLRGEGTPYSDLDLVVVFDQLPHAWRESFTFQGILIEAFVHDPETLKYFFQEENRPSGFAFLARMVDEGIEVPRPCAISQSLKQIARELLAAGPPPVSEDEERRLRYSITNLIDDIRQPRSQAELVASGTELYGVLANYYFRVNGLWSAKNKSIPRALGNADPDLRRRFREGFDALFISGQTGSVITLAEEILKPKGGFLFDGYRQNASPDR